MGFLLCGSLLQLVDVQWKVGVAMSSDECKSLSSPFVTLSLTVANPSGQLQTHTLELTMIQFRVSLASSCCCFCALIPLKAYIVCVCV